jgi:hypothetical protein
MACTDAANAKQQWTLKLAKSICQSKGYKQGSAKYEQCLTVSFCSVVGFKPDTNKFEKCMTGLLSDKQQAMEVMSRNHELSSLECLSLGFRVGTPKFGECIMSMNNVKGDWLN